MQGQPFSYFAYGAAVSEVVVDTLTGEWKLLRADALHDAGNSLNPAIDIGQVEGALHPGHGLADDRGTVAGIRRRQADDARAVDLQDPDRERLPADFNVRLFDNRNVGRHHPPLARRSASRRCCCRSRCSSRSATRSRRPAATASIRRSTRRPPAKRSCARSTRCAAQRRRAPKRRDR